MKKFLSLLLAAAMLLSCIPAMAEDSPEWKINNNSKLVARKSAAEKSESIVVPSEVNGMTVSGVEYMAFNMYKNFKQLTIEDGAFMLDRRVVRDLPKLETLDLPESLLVIREGNFSNVPMLTEVVIPASVALVHSSFNGCKSLKSITFEGVCPVFVTAGTFGMFTDLPADCVIYVPNNQVNAYKAAFADREDVVARIQPSGQYAYTMDWTAPESDFVFDAATGTITGYTGAANYLKIPATIGGVQVKHIAEEAFVKCQSLCYVVIPEGVETVGDYCFAGIILLSYVSLPSTLVSLGNEAFASSSTFMSAIAYAGDAVPAYDASAFSGFKGDWQLILPYGSGQDYVDAFAAYLAPAAAAGVVKASIIEPYSFPALDAQAAVPFLGAWYSVAGKDVMGDFSDYYPATTAVLNADGTGFVDVDGDEMMVAWFVDSGYAVIAPLAEDGSAYEDQAIAYANIDENGRLVADFGFASAICEQEGVVYAAPARPEEPWPEFDPSNAIYFTGDWEAVSYTVEGEIYPAELIGPMTLSLNFDGTALMTEGEGEVYELLWYAEYAAAYVGMSMNEKFKITFDGTGNIEMDMIDNVVTLAPKSYDDSDDWEDWDDYDYDGGDMFLPQPVDVSYVPGVADDFIGGWICKADPNMQLLLLDGEANMIDGDEVYTVTWSVVDGVAEFDGMKLYIQEDYSIGILEMYGDLVEFERGYVEKPKASASNAGVSDYGDDFDDYDFDDYDDDDDDDYGDDFGDDFGDMSDEEMLAFLKMLAMLAEMEEGDDADGAGVSYVGRVFTLTKVETVYNGQSYPGDPSAYGEYRLLLNADGSAEFVQGGAELPSEYLVWKTDEAGNYVVDYAVGGISYMNFVFTPVDGALQMDFYGTLMTLTPAE